MIALIVGALPTSGRGQPWLASVNHAVLRWLFAALPHSFASDSIAEFLVSNPILSTWIFGVVFFIYWQSSDQHTNHRRNALIRGLIALAAAVAISLAIRPWIAWIPPVANQVFRGFYPSYFWNLENTDSFPSHSTLVYFIVSLSFWPVSRRISASLMAYTLIAVSLPRMYVGGHYPIDVFASIVLALACYSGTRYLTSGLCDPCQQWAINPPTRKRELLLFVWVVELANGFYATNGALRFVLHVWRHVKVYGFR